MAYETVSQIRNNIVELAKSRTMDRLQKQIANAEEQIACEEYLLNMSVNKETIIEPKTIPISRKKRNQNPYVAEKILPLKFK